MDLNHLHVGQPDVRADSPLMTMSHSFLHDGMLLLSIPGPARDSAYYIHDGNTVLLVQNTLFRVHRSVLTKDKSTFETMFQLASETDSVRSDPGVSSSSGGTSEGDSDDNPIRLQGDTADEFRALLWALYALPNELMVATTPEANATQLANLVRVAHKYQFRSIMTWALSALFTFYGRPGAFDNVPSTAPPPPPTVSTHLHHGPTPPPTVDAPPTLVQLTELAALCERTDLLELALARWRRLIAEGRDLALAITVGERFSLRGVLGLAYHALMLKGRAGWDAEPLLTRDQRVRLLCGYYALSKLWDALPGQPPAITHSARCAHQQRCAKAWGALWRAVLDSGGQLAAITAPGSQGTGGGAQAGAAQGGVGGATANALGGGASGLLVPKDDFLGKVMLAESVLKALVEREIPSQGFLDAMPYCRESAMVAATMRMREIKESLAEYFVDDF